MFSFRYVMPSSIPPPYQPKLGQSCGRGLGGVAFVSRVICVSMAGVKRGGSHQIGRGVEKAVLVGIAHASRNGDGGPAIGADESLRELERLARTAQVEPVGVTSQVVRRVSPATYVGSGKVQEIADLLQETGASVVL